MGAVALRIGEVARRSGLSVRTLRHYDDLGLLVPSARSAGAQRLYAPADLHRLLTIQHLKALGLSLAEVRAALDDPGFDAATALSGHIAAVEAERAALGTLLGRLRMLESAAEAGWEEVLAVVALTERLRHPEAGVRVRAALDGGAAVPLEVLLARLADEPDDQVADTITWAITRHGRRAVGPLLAHLADSAPLARARAALALAKLADPRAVPALVSALADDDARVRTAAVVALGRIAHADGVPWLIGRLGGADADLVTDAIARSGTEATPALTEALGDRRPPVRRHAAEVLGAIGDPAAAEALAERLTDEDPSVRVAAAYALLQLPADVAEPLIHRARASADPRVRAVAARPAHDRGRSGRRTDRTR